MDILNTVIALLSYFWVMGKAASSSQAKGASGHRLVNIRTKTLIRVMRSEITASRVQVKLIENVVADAPRMHSICYRFSPGKPANS